MSPNNPQLALPVSWTKRVRAALLRIIALAQYASVSARGHAADSPIARARLQAENHRLRQEVALLREELRIKDARMSRIDSRQRPHYPPTERMAILELKAVRGWSQRQTALAFQITAATVTSWLGRLNEPGPAPLVQLRQPVNRFPDFVRYAVQRLKVLCPTLGKVKIAELLCRAGLHLAPASVGRMLREPPQPRPRRHLAYSARRVVTAKRPDHVWHVDLTTVPIGAGFWAPWLPCALPQAWPFCWWVSIVLDHYSRRVMGFAVFPREPDSRAVSACLGRAIRRAGAVPKYIICDKGSQFDCRVFRRWAHRRGVRLRYGAVGRHGSIALIERFIGTLKREATRRVLVPFRRAAFCRELSLFAGWYNEQRPHMALRGRTPHEVYNRLRPAHRRPRCEPRSGWPRGSKCAAPQALVAGQPGACFELDVQFLAGRRHLPIVRLKRAA